MLHAPLAKRTTRAIDRLALRAHAFHRFAHHPLCGRYAHELIPLGKRARVCRGCTSAALGVLAGPLAAGLVHPTFGVALLVSALGAALTLASLTLRLPKSLGRGLSSACVGFGFLGCLLSPAVGSLWVALGLLAASAAFFGAYRKRGPSRAPCQQCPERLLEKTCSGLSPIVRRERAFRRVAQRLIDAR